MIRGLRRLFSSAFQLLDKIHEIASGLLRLHTLVTDPRICRTFFPEEERKSKPRILLENLWWLLRHSDLNDFYAYYGFDRKHGVRQEEYLPYMRVRRIQHQTNRSWAGAPLPINYTCLLRDKFLFGQYAASLGFSTPKVLALCDGDRIFWVGSRRPERPEQIVEHQPFDGYCKPLMGGEGRGVFVVKVVGGSIWLGGKEVSAAEFREAIKCPSLLQGRITQHPDLAQFYPGCANTIRLLTALANGQPVALSAVMKFAGYGSSTDNWQRGRGGVVGKIDLQTGKLASHFFARGRLITRHPDTGLVFENFQVPFFHVAIEGALELHGFFYGVHSIGWDIAITEQGPCFIEGNDGWDIRLHQICDGGLKKKFLATLPPRPVAGFSGLEASSDRAHRVAAGLDP